MCSAKGPGGPLPGWPAGARAGWWSHLFQVAAVSVLAITAWLRPRIGGPLLLVVGTVMTTLMLLEVDDELATRLLAAVFVAPLIAAGVFCLLAGYGDPGCARAEPSSLIGASPQSR